MCAVAGIAAMVNPGPVPYGDQQGGQRPKVHAPQVHLRAAGVTAGRVVVRFAIGRDGGVLQASDEGSSLTDSAVIHDVVRAFVDLSFPTPEGGPVMVTLPIDFAP